MLFGPLMSWPQRLHANSATVRILSCSCGVSEASPCAIRSATLPTASVRVGAASWAANHALVSRRRFPRASPAATARWQRHPAIRRVARPRGVSRPASAGQVCSPLRRPDLRFPLVLSRLAGPRSALVTPGACRRVGSGVLQVTRRPAPGGAVVRLAAAAGETANGVQGLEGGVL